MPHINLAPAFDNNVMNDFLNIRYIIDGCERSEAATASEILSVVIYILAAVVSPRV